MPSDGRLEWRWNEAKRRSKSDNAPGEGTVQDGRQVILAYTYET